MNNEENKGLANQPLEDLDQEYFEDEVEYDNTDIVEDTIQDVEEYEEATGKHLSIPGEDYDPNEELQKEIQHTEECGEEYQKEFEDIDTWAEEKSVELDILFNDIKESDDNG